MSASIEQTLLRATNFQKAGNEMAALDVIERKIKKYPTNPRLVERRNLLRQEIIKSESQVNPPAFVLERLASLFDLQKWSELDRICGELIKVHPKSGLIINIYAVAKRENGNIQSALELHKKALSIDPQNTTFLVNFGNTLVAASAHDEAMQCFRRAIEIDENKAIAHNSLGCVYEDLGRNSAAYECFTRALEVDPDYADASYNLGAVKLRSFDFKNGWFLRDFKWLKADFKKEMAVFERPMWSGRKTGRLFIWAEQGIGDEVMFASCLEDLFKYADELLVSVSKKSLKLFKFSFPNIEFIERGTDVSELQFDDHIPAMSALGIVRQSRSSFQTDKVGYLRVEQDYVDIIRTKLDAIKGSGPIIGISWYSKAKRVGPRRSIPITDLVQNLPDDALLVNLQYGEVSNDIYLAKSVAGRKVHIIPKIDLNDDMQGLSALILACDHVVSIDNSTVHFAGALNKKCDVLLPFSADWRWGVNGTQQSVWYPSLNLHWQRQSDGWSETLKGLSENFH